MHFGKTCGKRAAVGLFVLLVRGEADKIQLIDLKMKRHAYVFILPTV